MRQILLGLSLCCFVAAGLIFGLNPDEVVAQATRPGAKVSFQPGASVVVLEQQCETTTTPLLSAAQMVNTKRVTIRNNSNGSSHIVNICPAATCTEGSGFKLTINKYQVIENALGQQFSCIATTGAVIVEMMLERDNAYPPTPTPSPTPSPTPTPTPTEPP